MTRKAFKYRLYPTQPQHKDLERTLELCRAVLSGGTGTEEGGKEDRAQRSEDREHDQELDQGESAHTKASRFPGGQEGCAGYCCWPLTNVVPLTLVTVTVTELPLLETLMVQLFTEPPGFGTLYEPALYPFVQFVLS